MTALPAPCLTVVTLGVRDLEASRRFYEKLGFVRKVRSSGEEIAFMQAGGVVVALWHWDKLAADAAQAGAPAGGVFRGATLAWNLATPELVDAAFAKGMAAGGKALRACEPTDYGGYRGYFADPDGHVWEVVCAPGFSFEPDGRLILPD
jgi:predicted lactoylglutathione lyase